MSITENKDGQRIITKQADTHIHRTLFFKLFSNFFKKNNNFKPTIFLDSSSEDDGMEINEEESYSNNVHQQEHIHRKTKVSRILILTVLSTSFGCSIPAGYNIGVINSPAKVLKQWCNETIANRYAINITPAGLDGLWSVLVSVFLIGGIIGGIAGGKLADLLGRKGTLKLTCLLNLLSGILFLSSKSFDLVEIFFTARFFSGLSAGLTMAMVPMYLLELAPPDLCGVFGVIFTVGLNFGVVLSQFLGLGNILGNELLWPYLLSLYAGLVILSLPILPFIPESPKYIYTVCNDHNKALSELSHLRGLPIPYISWELENLPVSSETWTFKRVLLDHASRKALIITCIIMLGQQFSGINAVFYYSTLIFENAGMNLAGAQYGNLGAGTINFIMTILATIFINNFGRKSLLLFSSIICTLMLTAMMITMVLSSEGSIPGLSYFLIAFVIGYVLFYGIGLGPIPFFIGSELTEVGPRPIIMSAMSVANWLGNFIVGLTFPLINFVLKQYSFFPFIACTIIIILFTWKEVPETKNTLNEELDPMTNCQH